MEKGKLIGQGGTAEVFQWGDKHIIKLYRKGIPTNLIENEFKNSRVVFQNRVSTPYAEKIVEVEDRKGIVYEFVDGITMTKFMMKKPWYLSKVAVRLAELQYEFHKCSVTGIASTKTRLADRIKYVDVLDDEKKNFILKYLDGLEDGNSLCHGDFHPDNILISGEKEIIIDWMDATYGSPLADVARTCIVISTGALPNNTSLILGKIIKLVQGKLYSEYIKKYIKISGVKMEEVEKWYLPVAAARLIEGISKEEKTILMGIIDEKIKLT